MNGEHRTSQLRISAARHRLQAFLDQIEYLETSNFPHPDGLDALKHLKEYTQEQIDRLRVSPATAPALVDQLCAQARMAVSRYTPILGFILRSTNVRNAFEVQFPLKRIVKLLMGKEAKLLISSEWAFVPFTYPMTIERLPHFSLVGGPASESGNILTIPLAGHEIGHSAWKVHGIRAKLEPALLEAVRLSITRNSAETRRLNEQLGLGELGLGKIRHLCALNGLKQLEEIFCDTVGLYLFGPSYLFATEYFLAPGGRPRSLTYPSDSQRLYLLKKTATSLKLTLPEKIFDRWQDSVLTATQSRDFAMILDDAVADVAQLSIDQAVELLRRKGFPVCRQKRVHDLVTAFGRGDPDPGDANLAEIVTAGWEIATENAANSSEGDAPDYRLLNDLMLKAVEVSEFKHRMKKRA